MKNPGRIVVMKDGRRGRTYNKKGLIQGKVPVHPFGIEQLDGSKPMLCKPEDLIVIGFID